MRRLGAGGRAGLVLLAVPALAAVLLPPFLPDPLAQPDLLRGLSQPPGPAHWFGTDALSRDVLARTVHGARWSLGLAIPAVLVSLVLGTAVGTAAALGGRRLDAVLMRGTEALLAIPRLFVLLLLTAAADALPAWGIALVLGLTGWLGLAKLVRAESVRLRGEEFMAAARALGASRWRLATRHLLPNLAGPLAVAGTIGLGDAMLLEAGLGFLGLGLQPPTPTWGAMLLEGRDALVTAPWTSLFPGAALACAVLGAHLLGDALRAALDPRETPRA